MQLEKVAADTTELEDETGYSAYRISLYDGQSWFGGTHATTDLATQFASTGYLLKVTDTGGKSAYGYIGAAEGGEALGSELLSGWDFTSGWGTTNATINDADTYTLTAAAGYIKRAGLLTVNKQYKAVTAWTVSSGNNKILDGAGGTAYLESPTGGTGYGVAKDAMLLLRGVDNGAVVDVSSLSIKEVTSSDITAVTIYKSTALSTEGWASIQSGFDPNAISTFEVYNTTLDALTPRTYTATSGSTATIPAEGAFDDNGLVNVVPVTNWLLYGRDWTQANWTKTTTTTALDVTGVDGVANSATRLTATGANSTVTQASTLSTTTNTFSFYAKRITGTGTVSMTDDNFVSSTNITLTSVWQKFSINDAGAAPTVGIKIVTSGDVIAVDFGALTSTGYTLPFVIPTTTVPVATTAQVASWTMSTALKSILSDAVGGATSEGTMIVTWRPGLSSGSGNAGLVGVRDNVISLLYQSGGAGLNAYDGTTFATQGTGYSAGTSYYYAVRWSKSNNQLQVSRITGGTLTNGTATAYDGAFTLGTQLHIGYSNNYPFSIKDVRFYDAWLSDNELLFYPQEGGWTTPRVAPPVARRWWPAIGAN